MTFEITESALKSSIYFENGYFTTSVVTNHHNIGITIITH